MLKIWSIYEIYYGEYTVNISLMGYLMGLHSHGDTPSLLDGLFQFISCKTETFDQGYAIFTANLHYSFA